MSKMNNNFHIAIEGVIGAGKTTFCGLLQNYLNNLNIYPKVLTENINAWRSFGKEKINLLDKLYSNPNNYAYYFQQIAALTKVEQLSNSLDFLKITERTLESQLHVFIPILFEKKYINQLQKDILEKMITNLSEIPYIKPDLIIYLKIDPVNAFQRIVQRKRSEEKNFTFENVQQLHIFYEKWITNLSQTVPVIIVNEQSNFEKIFEKIYSTSKTMISNKNLKKLCNVKELL